MLLASGLWSSAKSCRSQDSSATPLATAWYSASALERETTSRRLDDQETTLPPRKPAGSGAASVRAASPVSVSVDHQLRGGRAVKNQAEANSATDVVEETLQCSKVRLPRIMHVKTDLLNGIGEIRPGEGQVLQGTGKALVGSRISHGTGSQTSQRRYRPPAQRWESGEEPS